MKTLTIAAWTLLVAFLSAPFAAAQDQGNGSDLAKKLSNPVADMISLPFQYNFNDGYGPAGQGKRSQWNIQPVIPFSISPTWNVISRTIVPLIDQDGVAPGGGSQSGFGNITQSFFFSPKAPTKGGLIWGAGPVIQLPTANNGIAPDQWALGVTGVVLKQSGPLTIGALGNHLWSVSGEDRFGELSATFLQPFISYTTPTATTFSLNTESTYDWVTNQWSIPINIGVAQVVRFGAQPVQLSLGARYWAESPAGGPQGWGGRFAVTWLFPK